MRSCGKAGKAAEEMIRSFATLAAIRHALSTDLVVGTAERCKSIEPLTASTGVRCQWGEAARRYRDAPLSFSDFRESLLASSFVSNFAAERRPGSSSKRLSWCISYQALKVWTRIPWLHWISDRLAPVRPSIWNIRARACGAAHRLVC
jgi:hypothetical protein